MTLSMAAVFLASTQGALFGPSKYGLLPEILPEKRLSWGNGVIELGTFLAAITGTVVGARLSEVFAGPRILFRNFFPRVLDRRPCHQFWYFENPAADLRSNSASTSSAISGRKANSSAGIVFWWLAVLGNTYFFFLGALLQFNIVFYARDVLRVTATHGSLLQAAIAIGIGLGSLAAGYLSGGKN